MYAKLELKHPYVLRLWLVCVEGYNSVRDRELLKVLPAREFESVVVHTIRIIL
jgi:hypothetical protein